MKGAKTALNAGTRDTAASLKGKRLVFLKRTGTAPSKQDQKNSLAPCPSPNKGEASSPIPRRMNYPTRVGHPLEPHGTLKNQMKMFTIWGRQQWLVKKFHLSLNWGTGVLHCYRDRTGRKREMLGLNSHCPLLSRLTHQLPLSPPLLSPLTTPPNKPPESLSPPLQHYLMIPQVPFLEMISVQSHICTAWSRTRKNNRATSQTASQSRGLWRVFMLHTKLAG